MADSSGTTRTCVNSARGGGAVVCVAFTTSRRPPASTTGSAASSAAYRPSAATTAIYGTNGVRRIETTRRETSSVRAETSSEYAAFGTAVSNSSVMAWGNTSGGSVA